MMILITCIIIACWVFNVYLLKPGAVIKMGVWNSCVLGISYVESEDEEGDFAIIEIYIVFFIVTLIYDR